MTTTPPELPVAGLVERLTLYGTFFAEGMTQPDTLPEEAAAALTAQAQRIAGLKEALRPFADCCDQIDDVEDDEEWAKFRLLIKNYRRARAALQETPDAD